VPGGGDADVDAEHPGQNCGGQVGGEPEQGGGTGLCRAGAEVAQSFGEWRGADGLAGEQPWEQDQQAGEA
jgi:hypothetical protein